jgi:hypothetical protein
MCCGAFDSLAEDSEHGVYHLAGSVAPLLRAWQSTMQG